MEMIGQLLDRRYRIVQILNSGAFGQTYLAADMRRPGHPHCVVKQLRPPNNNSHVLKTALRLFGKEAEILEKLGRHPQIPMLLAYFEENNNFYLVEEFIEGHPLNKELIPGSPWHETRVIQLLIEILEVLVFVHKNNVIHRDVNPSNIVRRKSDQQLVLIDFGSVKEVSTQLVNGNGQSMRTIATGTPSYMPMEQFQGNPQFSSDIYAVGMIAIQAITGLESSDLPKLQDPSLSTNGEVSWRHRANVNAGFSQIIDKMVHHYYGKRYPSAQEVLTDLNQLAVTTPSKPKKSKKQKNNITKIDFSQSGKIIGITLAGCVSLLVLFGLLRAINRPDPIKARAALDRGVEQLRNDNPSGAVKTLTKAVRLNPNNAEAFNQRGNAYYELDSPQQAVNDFNQAIQLAPDYKNAYFNRGWARYDLKDFSGAVQDYTRVIELDPMDLDAYYQRGVVYYQQDNFKAAIADYSRVIELDSQQALAYRSRGTARIKAGDLQGGLSDYTQAIRLNPEDAAAYYDRGRTRFHLGDYQGALSDYNQVVELEPENEQTYANRCSAQINLSQHQAAVEDCSKAIELRPSSVAYNNRCVAYLNLDQYSEAIADCTEAIALSDRDSKAYSNRGMAQSGAQNYREAIADYTEAISLNPNDAEAYGNRAAAYFQLEDYEQAIADYVQAIRLKPTYAAAYYGRGQVRAFLGDQKGAISDFQTSGKLYLEQGLTGGYKDSQFQIQQLQ
ncbi:MAG: tetratricopeptide repeat protein [Microcoleaceae cyanobacterium]